MGTLGWNLPRHEHDAGADTRKERGHLAREFAEEPGIDGVVEDRESERLLKARAYRTLLLELTRIRGVH